VSAKHVLAVAVAHRRELLRRRFAVGMLIALPLAFYASAASAEGSFVLITGGLGVAWALTGTGLFVGLASRRLAPRLVLSGYRPNEILAGQMLLLAGFALPMFAVFTSILLVAEQPAHSLDLVVAVLLTALIAVPLGLLLGSLCRGELEGTLSLIGVLGVQMSLPVSAAGAEALPFYGPMVLLESAYGTQIDTAVAVPHSIVAIGLLTAAAFAAWNRRVRVADVTQSA